MIQIEDVRKSYQQGSHGVEVLRGVSMEVQSPGFYAIMGPSGSGKSTLLHLLAGLDRCDSGRVVVDGHDLGALDERSLTRFRRRKLGIVFQQFNLIPTLTARQNIELPGVLDGRSRNWLRERSARLLEQLDMMHRAEHRPDAMSGGEQQRVAIARAMLFEPPLLLADEPTGNLDSASSDRLWALLGELARQQSMLVLMVTHEPAAAVHCSRVFVMRDGTCRGSFGTEGLNLADVAACYQQFGR
ncbi:MAG: ABC transporter ATP-binding protein [Phycisphaeraceae bacterium]|nr:ABC transporter ATP-binding protein [Phycisphaeraceae bacterium]